MKKNLEVILDLWPKNSIRAADIDFLLGKTDDARYSHVKRALKEKLLVRIKRGLYFIPQKTAAQPLDEFEVALRIHAPSFVSLESALSHYGWIPETVYTTTCVSTKRAHDYKTPIGTFSYSHIPAEHFYTGVNRIETASGAVFIASPWRALADLIYTRRKTWNKIDDLEADLRIDFETIMESDKDMLEVLTREYPSRRVRNILRKFLKELEKQK